ncbi:MAG TPA: hypothetical protein QF446_10450 [Planctomycetota bacterium]|nr:hypothetical protein [Planctomycetota bacterium]
MLRRFVYGLALPIALTSLATAGDRVFTLVTSANSTDNEVYDFDTGTLLGTWPTPNQMEMERSQGEAYVYSLTASGDLTTVDTRTLSHSWGSVAFGTLDIAPNAARLSLDAVDRTGSIQLYYAPRPSISSSIPVSPWSMFENVVGTPQGNHVYAVNGPFGGPINSMVELRLPMIRFATVAQFDFDVNELLADPDSRYIFAIGADTFGYQPLNNPGDPIHVAMFDRWTGTVQSLLLPAGAGEYRGAAISETNPSSLWVGTDSGVQPLAILGNKLYLVPTMLGSIGVRDVNWCRSGNLYVAYNDRVDRYQGGIIPNGTMAFPNSRTRGALVVVRDLVDPKAIVGLVKPEWVGLLKAVAAKDWGLPLGWFIDESQLPGEKCDPKAVMYATKRALSWLGSLKDKDRTLDPSQVADFLSQAKGSSPQAGEHFLDIIFLGTDLD